MAKATTTITFADGDQITSAKLNQIMSGFSLGADSVDGVTILNAAGVLSMGVAAAANIGADAVTTSKILDENVTAAKLATDAVETAKIKDAAVTTAKVADATLTFAKLATAAVGTQTDNQSEAASKLVAAAFAKYLPPMAKAYGRVDLANGSAALTGAYNVASATESGTDREIVFTTAMANANYVVTLGYESASPIASIPVVSAKSASGFTISPGAEAASRFIVFTVHGQLTA
jgi:hypothetical protein